MPMSRLSTETLNQIAETVTQSFRPALMLQQFANSVISSMQDTQESAICLMFRPSGDWQAQVLYAA